MSSLYKNTYKNHGIPYSVRVLAKICNFSYQTAWQREWSRGARGGDI